jgi:hypothetical protein
MAGPAQESVSLDTRVRASTAASSFLQKETGTILAWCDRRWQEAAY